MSSVAGAARLLAKHPDQPLQAFWEALTAEPHGSALAMAVAQDPLCGLNRSAPMKQANLHGLPDHHALVAPTTVTPLLLAAFAGRADVIEALLAASPTTPETSDVLPSQVLSAAALSGNVAAVELVMAKLAGPAALVGEADNDAPLHYAAMEGHTAVMEVLLVKGAPVNAVGKYGRTALHLLADNADAIELLVSNDADVNMRDLVGYTPLHYAARLGSVVGINTLIAKGAKPDEVDYFGGAPLHSAAEFGHVPAIQALLAKGATIDLKDKNLCTPLQFAAEEDRTPALEALLAHGAAVDAQNKYMRTPLHYVAENGNAGAVQMLLSRGATVNACDESNQTPLHCAAENGHVEVIELLIAEGAIVNALDAEGHTPLDCAINAYYEYFDYTDLSVAVSKLKSYGGITNRP